MNSVLATGLQGINKSMDGAVKAANDIARAGQISPTANAAGITEVNGQGSGEVNLQMDLAESMVDLKVYEQSYKASAKVLEVATETVGTLLDIKT